MTEPLVTQGDPAEFDITEFVKGFRAKTFTAQVHKRTDLSAEITRLLADVELYDEETAAGAERSVAEAEERNEKAARANELVDIYEAPENVVTFEFRPASGIDRERAALKARDEGVDPDSPDERETMICYNMAETCVSPRMTGKAFMQIRETVGDQALLGLMSAFFESVITGEESILDFLSLRSRITGTNPSSAS